MTGGVNEAMRKWINQSEMRREGTSKQIKNEKENGNKNRNRNRFDPDRSWRRRRRNGRLNRAEQNRVEVDWY